ncbi:DNA helicase PIF1, ATP-dependent [Corchorus olitorius]|uniref:ATP-dependent DNA helicase n=1 Tax=Corchorus olitorius TaxID=93759 RepID=A0A1R3IT99_9ROSI|nr:DNA helicase PIF1, ATP-dependent [Corchorus olitorius]
MAKRSSESRVARVAKRRKPVKPTPKYFQSSTVTDVGELQTVECRVSWVRGLSQKIIKDFEARARNSISDGDIPSSSKDNCIAHRSRFSMPFAQDLMDGIGQAMDHRSDMLPAVDSTHIKNIFQYNSFGGPSDRCQACNIFMWSRESVGPHSGTSLRFSLCCQQGLVRLPALRDPPPFLDDLFDHSKGGLHEHFRSNIRTYNSLIQFTSLGGKIDSSINDGSFPFIFRVNNQTHHRIGPLLPPQGRHPTFSQLYIYDTQNELANRMSAIAANDNRPSINAIIVESLILMFDEVNEIAKAFRMARERFEQVPNRPFRLRLIASREGDGRNYCPPTSSHIAGIIVDDSEEGNSVRDIIVEHRSGELQHISITHPLYMSMQYPILFPYGDDGFTVGIPYADSPLKQRPHRKTQFLVDVQSTISQSRLQYIRQNQRKIRVEMHKDVSDAIYRGDNDGNSVGKRIILPASFTGSPRYMFQSYQDAIVICREYGFPDLFITFTCNGNWPEIEQALSSIPGQRPEDRPDIVARVFKLKLDELLDDLTKREYFGLSSALTYNIEFQKRGLPHVHILLWLKNSSAFRVPQNVDRCISAELPDQAVDPIGYEAVKGFMMHGPCGLARRTAPCMNEGRCNKYYPKEFQLETKVNESGYYLYRRRDSSITCKKSGIDLDNRFVVPHNLDLVIRYMAHINVEVCTHSRVMKQEMDETVDEVKTYLDGRYLCAYEAAWRIFGFPINHKQPAVVRLPIHLQGEQNIYFHDGEDLQAVLNRLDVEKTMFTEWMAANDKYEAARSYLYADFPTGWVWNGKNKDWTPRQRGETIGRIIHVHYAAGEVYYLRLLLNVDDNEWQEALDQTSQWATADYLRELFVYFMMHSRVVNPALLFEKNWRLMSDDIERRFSQAIGMPNYVMDETDLRNYVLLALDEMLSRDCSSLAEKNLPQPTMPLADHYSNRPFGGLTVVMGGDFRQILPVIPGGTKADILRSAICTSPLWDDCIYS